MRPERACAQTHSLVTPSRSATSSAVSRGVIDARSSLEAPAALLAELALQSPLGDAAGHLAVLGVIVAVLDERSRAVVLFDLLSVEGLDASRELGLGVAKVLELAAAMREP